VLKSSADLQLYDSEIVLKRRNGPT